MVVSVANGRQQHADSVSVLQQSNRLVVQMVLLVILLLVNRFLNL